MIFCSFFQWFIVFTIISYTNCGYEDKIRQLNYRNREPRDCALFGPHVAEDKYGFYTIWILILVVIVGLIILLLMMGLIKGILGLCCFPPIGMWGLGVLIDLPRPLDHYQEKDLWQSPVEYDIIGWPIHPVTKERTVRALPKRTEFCLNVIFFLAYPIVMCIDVVSLCCFRTYDHDNDKQQCFQGVNTVVFANCTGKKKKLISKESHLRKPKIYNDDNDTEEEKDTQYVLNMMRHSEETLKEHIYQ